MPTPNFFELFSSSISFDILRITLLKNLNKLLLYLSSPLTDSTKLWYRGSSGSIVSDYGLDDRVIEVQSPSGAEDFSSRPCVQNGSEAHPASYPMDTGDSFPGGKARPGRDADHSPPSSAEV
jgi:hypothetical protein